MTFRLVASAYCLIIKQFRIAGNILKMKYLLQYGTIWKINRKYHRLHRICLICRVLCFSYDCTTELKVPIYYHCLVTRTNVPHALGSTPRNVKVGKFHLLLTFEVGLLKIRQSGMGHAVLAKMNLGSFILKHVSFIFTKTIRSRFIFNSVSVI